MQSENISNKEVVFNSAEEEIAYLKAQVLSKERELMRKDIPHDREEVIRTEIENHKNLERESALKDRQISHEEREAIVLNLKPKPTDSKVEELLGVVEDKGIINAVSIVEKMNDPILEDDFHRVLVQYIKEGLPFHGISEKSPIFHALKMTLFEISLPPPEGGERERSLKELLSSMEQFYAGIEPNLKEKNEMWFSFEIAVSEDGKAVVIYAAVPNSKIDLFEKQILSIFPKAKIREEKNDYNIFKDNGFVSASKATLSREIIYPIKTYDDLGQDPLSILLNAFSKIAESGEGASIQFLFGAPTIDYTYRLNSALKQIEKGKKLSEAIDIRDTMIEDIAVDVSHRLKEFFRNESENKDTTMTDEKSRAIEAIKKKMDSPIVSVGIRVVVSTESKERSDSIRSEIEASFNQFTSTTGNKFVFEDYKVGEIAKLLKDFSFRVFDRNEALPLSLKELTTIFHFPVTNTEASPDLKQSLTHTAPAPLDIGKSGIYLGKNIHRNSETDIYFDAEDRMRHFYVIGQTGVGKSTLLNNMVIQDIQNGEGVCMIDPHGSDIQKVLSAIPKNRAEDVIYFDPANVHRPMGLNMLEYDARFPEQKTFVVNELVSIFNKLFDMKVSGGPAFEQYFRNSALLVMDHPESGSTLLEIARVMQDKSFRDMKLSHCTNPLVKQFWASAERTSGDQGLANYVPYITNKFDGFLSNDIMRPIVAQQKSSFNFRDIMDSKKILLVNLSKGRLGEINTRLIGLILVGKILMAALSRVDSFGKDLPPFYLYMDEFQNITTDSISMILSEARKYKLSLNIAHQLIAQLDEGIKTSVFGNVGSMAVFRVGPDDAEYLAKQFEPTFSAKEMMNIENANAYLKMLVRGSPSRPFSLKVAPPIIGDLEVADLLKELSSLKFGSDRKTVEEDIKTRFESGYVRK